MKNKESFIPLVESITKKAEKCKLNPNTIKSLQPELKVISDFLGVSNIQALFLAVIIIKNIDTNDVSLMQLAEYLDVDPIIMLNYINDFNFLVENNHLCIATRRRSRSFSNTFRNDYTVPERVVNALFTGKKPDFAYKKKMTIPEILFAVNELCETKKEGEITLRLLYQEITVMIDANSALSMIKKLRAFVPSIDEQIAFLYMGYEEFEHERAVELSDISEIVYDDPNDKYRFKKNMVNKKSPLMKNKLVCFEKDRFFDDRYIMVDKKGKELIYGNDAKLMEKPKTENDSKLMLFKKIKEKHLFYNEQEDKKINELITILDPANFVKMEKRMEKAGMPAGFNVLFYGTPGTGKTETVMQLAKKTGRDIMSIDISKTKSFWFGESEKLIKGIFDDYRKLAEKSKKAPILLLNEADGILSKRKDVGRGSVAQTENAIQNIILTEMETLKGILIATTNLTQNLDFAFERRFLYKIKFEKPSIEARVAIWKDKMSWLDDNIAGVLSDSFDFSGGQIENIARRSAVMDLLEGRRPHISELKALCTEELIENDRGKIGFINN